MPLASWLFLRGTESIWVERPQGYQMVVAGPGPQREEREFSDEEALQEYQISLAGRLSAAGWFLAAYDYERRQARDRRAAPRNAADRRLG
jgi:hypothetical protein